MHVNDRFATRAKRVEETPEPFRSAMAESLWPKESVRLLVYGPSFTSLGIRSPASLLAVTDQRWIMVLDDETGVAHVATATFDDTLLVELARIVLHGHLKFDYGSSGASQSVMAEFNTVEERLYREAVELILGGIINGIGDRAAAGEPHNSEMIPQTWPMGFRNAAISSVLPGRTVRGAALWPAVHGGFRRELSPAAALLVTDRELVLIAEERTRRGVPTQSKYGHILTYFPLIRLAQFHVTRHERFCVLGLEMHASHGGERLEIIFNSDAESAVSETMNQGSHASNAQRIHQIS